MLEQDKGQFKAIMIGLMDMYNRTITADSIRIWWGALAPYSLDQVQTAIGAHVTGDRGTYAPLPADVIKLINGNSGHLPPDEAWALALTSLDDENSIIWTAQIAEAWGAAWPCMENGDKYGARLAFLSAYERIIKQGTAVWKVSLGYSHEGRERAVDEALSRGLITPERAAALLPYNCQKIPSASGLLPAPEKTEKQKAQVKEMLSLIRNSLEKPNEEA